MQPIHKEAVSRRRFMRMVGGTAVTSAILAACVPAGGTPAPGGGTPAPAAETPATSQRGTLIGLSNQTPNNFNPMQAVQGIQGQFFALVLPGMIAQNLEQTAFLPSLAQSWETSDDGTEYTFHLHPDAKWHDGTPLTADDVAYTYHLFLNPDTKSRRVSNLAMIKGATAYTNKEATEAEGIQVLDDQTIRFVTEYPTPLFLYEAVYPILPKHLLGDIAPDQLENDPFFFERPLGSGPFKFVEYQTEQFIRLEANDTWHWGAPKLGSFIFQLVASPDTGQIALTRGEAHFTATGGVNTSSADVIQAFLDMGNFKVVALTGTVYTGYAFNLRHPHWQDKRTRQAWWYALDRVRLLDTFSSGNGKLFHTPLIHNWIQVDDLNPYDYNPELARQLLEEAGWDFEQEVVINLITLSSEQARAQVAAEQQMLQEVGFNVTIEEMDSSVWVERFYDTHDYDAVRVGFGTFPDPDGFLKFHLVPGSRYASGYADYIGGDFADKVTEAGQLVDQDARHEIYVDIQRTLNDDPPHVVLWVSNLVNILDNRVVIPGITDQRTVQTLADLTDPLPAKTLGWIDLEEWDFTG